MYKLNNHFRKIITLTQTHKEVGDSISSIITE